VLIEIFRSGSEIAPNLTHFEILFTYRRLSRTG
jgi:hypothetical protein